MEASISSGSDGFGSESSNAIRSYLSRVACDAILPSGNTPSVPLPSPTIPTASTPTPPSLNGCPTTPEVTSPKCISVGNVANGFACYSLSQILPANCPTVLWSVTTCDGITIKSPRRLANVTSLEGDNVDVVDDDGTIQEDQVITFIAASNTCSKSCILSTKKRICLSAQRDMKDHVISFKAMDRNSGNTIRTFQRTIPIRNNNSNNICRPANLQCTTSN
jgi:hypothetical protein